jgi:hypothetical protein
VRAAILGHSERSCGIPPRPQMMAALRERCEALAAEYAAPLPEGDTGIIEAMRRLEELNPRGTALYREFGITMDMESEVFPLLASLGTGW